ncbi:hypothetical protein M2152_001338 [Microbacteriaceae bacterium SG_E_30_P1]|uniref:PH domain-containing protein n=1 Tax=Antiquaquibacter oligotrophicus TaxID=2880260 RepID=A0ABT6KMB9_9MICO|nr:hypothetical protein [Antiquaquibacter oligotrophicus]MDH6181156.1 hypothetical protein [Antiquaquibacter oligotrophicus]UDF13148.1 hypothetical protein LH407_13450 [Antiquaquibacter oligotrophicus]
MRETTPQVLGQIPWLRPAAFIPGGALVAAGVALAFKVPFAWESVMVSGFFAAVGTVLSLRFWRMCVILHEDRIVIRGFLWSRTVPRDRVTGLSPSRWLISRTRNGRPWVTPITVFWNFGPAPLWFESHNGAAMIRIRHWIERRPARPPQHRGDGLPD